MSRTDKNGLKVADGKKLLGWAKALGPPTMGNCLIWCSVPFTFGIRYLIRGFTSLIQKMREKLT